MDWPQISQVLSIKPVTDERQQREWIKKNTKHKKKNKKENIQQENKKSSSGSIDIYV